MVINSPSLANLKFTEMEKSLQELVDGGVHFFHIDIIDGHYLPNMCLTPQFVRDVKEKYPQIKADIHLMVTNPQDYLDTLQKAGADYVSFHCDSTHFVRRTLTAIRERGMKAGVVINPSQRIDVIEPYIHWLDYVVLMSVEPGYAGQKFLDGSLERVEELAALRQHYQASFLISMDGGMTYQAARGCIERGANMIVTGVYAVFNQPEGICAACVRWQREMDQVKLLSHS